MSATPVDKLEELSSGSGQINPVEASHPGLLYDIGLRSYVRLLCTEGYDYTLIGLLMGGKKKFNCSTLKPARGVDGINYPSMHIQLNNMDKVMGTFFHTVTNVRNGSSIYKVTATPPKGLAVKVIPSTLRFDWPGQKRSFKVVVEGITKSHRSEILSGPIVWSNAKHTVRSSFIVYVGR